MPVITTVTNYFFMKKYDKHFLWIYIYFLSFSEILWNCVLKLCFQNERP